MPMIGQARTREVIRRIRTARGVNEDDLDAVSIVTAKSVEVGILSRPIRLTTRRASERKRESLARLKPIHAYRESEWRLSRRVPTRKNIRDWRRSLSSTPAHTPK